MAELTSEKLLWMLSCLLLGVELLYRRFHWFYVCLYICMIVDIMGLPISLISFTLYICLMLWVIYCRLISARDVDDGKPLYLGKKIDLVKNTYTRRVQWTVVVKKLLASGYDVTIQDFSRKGIYKAQKFNNCYLYHLDHVGWCDLKLIEVQQGNSNEPFVYLSNEAATSVALQITDSKIYTYCKCMELYRPDTLVVYFILLCSLVAYQFCSLPVRSIGAVLNSLVPFITAIINLIAVIEISMLQPGERFTLKESFSYFCSAIPQDFRKFENYCQQNITCSKILSLGIIIGAGISAGIFTKFYRPENIHHVVNLSREPEAAGPKVVDTVVSQIESAKIFEDDHMHDYVRRIAMVESKDGLDNTTYREGYHGGLWQVDEMMFLVTKNTSYSILRDKYKIVKKQFDTDWMSVHWKDLRIPLWSGLAACLYMCTVDEEIPSSIDKQADHWNRNYNSKKESPRKPEEFVVKVKELEMNTECYRDIDLFIVMDSSGSINKEKYEIAKKFVADLVNGFTISEKNVRVGLIIFSGEVKLIFGLKDSFDKKTILNKISNIPFLRTTTATGDAIQLMVESGFTEANGARPPNLAIPRVGIVLTDGESNTGVDVHVAAQAARNKSIEMFAFGIGSRINDTELLEIAGSRERKFKIDSFDNIDDARALIAQTSCKVGIKANMSTTYKDSLDNGKSRLFEYAVPREGITIYVQVTKGTITLYGSHSNHDPSPVWHEYMLSSIQDHKKITISYPTALKKHESTIPFYCNLVGVGKCIFSIKAVNGTQ